MKSEATEFYRTIHKFSIPSTFLPPACKEYTRNHVRRFAKPYKKAAHILRSPVVFDAPSCSEL